MNVLFDGDTDERAIFSGYLVPNGAARPGGWGDPDDFGIFTHECTVVYCGPTKCEDGWTLKSHETGTFWNLSPLSTGGFVCTFASTPIGEFFECTANELALRAPAAAESAIKAPRPKAYRT